jgi:hypothetical protein
LGTQDAFEAHPWTPHNPKAKVSDINVRPIPDIPEA